MLSTNQTYQNTKCNRNAHGLFTKQNVAAVQKVKPLFFFLDDHDTSMYLKILGQL